MTDISKAVERLKSTLHEGLNQNDWGISRDELRANDLAALIAFYDALQWRPIEQAPRDGTTVLVYYKEVTDKYHIVKAFYAQNGWQEVMENGDAFNSMVIVLGDPTHFIPLSAIPLPEESK